MRFHTQELTDDDKVTLFGFSNAFGYMLFAEQPINEDELKLELIRKDTAGKSPSQRIRGVIFRIWEQNGKSGNFETYYGETMERIINQLKEKLA